MQSDDDERYVRIAPVTAIGTEQPLVVVHCAYRIAIYRDGDQFYALEDICPHMGAFLSNGFREAGEVVCPWHHWRFGLTNGECTSNDLGNCVQTFPIKVVDDYIWLPARISEEDLEEIEEF